MKAKELIEKLTSLSDEFKEVDLFIRYKDEILSLSDTIEQEVHLPATFDLTDAVSNPKAIYLLAKLKPLQFCVLNEDSINFLVSSMLAAKNTN